MAVALDRHGDELDHFGMPQVERVDVVRQNPASLERVFVRDRFREEPLARRVKGARPNDETPPRSKPAFAARVGVPLLFDLEERERLNVHSCFFFGLANRGVPDGFARLDAARRRIPKLAVFPLSDDQDVSFVLDDDKDEKTRRDGFTSHGRLNVADPNCAIQAFFAAHSCNICIMPESAGYPGDLIEHLRGFATLANVIEGGAGTNAFVRAASQLALDPSVLRRRLQTLTDYVGSPLLSGRGSALKLTMAGGRVRSQAAQMIDLASAVGRHARDADHVGPLRVACTGTILAEVLPGILAWMRGQYEQLRFRVRREGAESSRSLVEKGEIDFAIVRGASDRDPTTTDGRIHARKVAEDRLWLAVHVNHPLSRSKRITPAEIAKATLVGYPAPSATMKRLMSVLGPLGASPWIEVDRKAAALAYVGAGLGVGFISRVTDQAPPKHKNVVMRDVTSMFPRTSFWLISHKAPSASQTKWKRDFAERLEMAMLKTGAARNRA